MQDMDSSLIQTIIELTLLPGFGTSTQNRIWKFFPEIGKLFEASSNALKSLGFRAEVCSMIRTRACRARAEEIYDWGIRHDCRFLMRGETGYPTLLEEIYDPPLILYARGNPEALKKPCIAIVGTRRPTIYGLQMAQGLGSDLGCRGIAVASGLARGIDGAVHRGCLEADGTTIAVLGCGIDVVYPKEHRQLSQKVEQKGLLVTEFTPGTSPLPRNFPLRNRIISGLGLGTVVVEASEYSGSLITARLAMEQNREVFAVPGNLTSPQSIGPNYLIKQGAKLIQTWRDVIEELPETIRERILIQEDKSDLHGPKLELMDADEAKLMKLLKRDEALHFDRILSAGGFSIPLLSGLLLKLETDGWVRQLPGNLYVKSQKPGG